ncbi:SRPBCC family protein [Dactylosporangium salmoneum]|uniref:SRPBCC family protein n=1 Tax=Dactylosporangium salmoneum TaxID=53361 RepID=A0ABP5U6Z5_9ACTN
MNDTTERSQTHATFVIERTYPVPVEEVWHALSDNDARDQWFGGGPAFDVEHKSHDFRVGGRAVEEGQWHGGPRSRFESTYTDIVDRRRIVFTYDMWVDGQHLSTSLTTIAVEPGEDATRLTYTEQGVHFDGLDSVEGREEGTRGILDGLATFLTQHRRP